MLYYKSRYIYLDNKSDKEIVHNLFKEFAISSCYKLGFNIKQDQRFIFTNICDEISNFSYDLLIGCYLLDSTRNHKFNTILSELFGIILESKDKSKEQVQLSLFEATEEDKKIDSSLSKDIALATKCIYNSKEIIDKKLKEDGMYDLMYNIEIPLSETLANMETVGMYVDKKKA